MPSIADLVHQLSTSTGSGNFTLSTVNGKQSFDTAFGHGANTSIFFYYISNRDVAEYEFGLGHMTDATTLVRDQVLGGTNGTSAVTFSAGTKDVTNDLPAARQLQLLGANKTLFVRTAPANVSISIASPGNVTWTAHGLSANDPVVFAILPQRAAVTVTIASPGVVTWTGHGFAAGQPIKFETTNGALPTGITAGTTYFVIATGLATNTFQFSTTVGGAAVNTSGSQSGSHFGSKTGTMPTGLSEGTVYYAKTIVDANTFTVSATPGGAAINTTGSTSGQISASTGNNANDGSAADRAHAILDLQTAANLAWSAYDLNGFSISISCADSTYLTGASVSFAPIGEGGIAFVGNTTIPANCRISATSANCFTANYGAAFTIDGFKVETTTSGSCVQSLYGSTILANRIVYGSCASDHQTASHGGTLINQTDYTITGGASAHWHSGLCGQIQVGSNITITGTPAFGSYFAGSSTNGVIFAVSVSFTGLATGSRYLCHSGSQIDMQNSSTSDTFLPGNVGGVAYDGAYYNTTHDSASSWAGYTPTVTPLAGSFTSVSAAGRYRFLDAKTLAITIDFTVTTAGGSAPATALFTLPPGFTGASSRYSLSGLDMSIQTSAGLCAGFLFNTTNVGLSAPGGTWTNGHIYTLTGVLEGSTV